MNGLVTMNQEKIEHSHPKMNEEVRADCTFTIKERIEHEKCQ